MALSKKSATGFIVLILIVGLAMFIIAPPDNPNSPEETFPTDDSNDTNPNEQDNSNISQIDINGINVQSDGTISLEPGVIVNSHRSHLLNTSVNITYDSPETETEILKFGNRILITEDVSFATVRTYSNGVLIYKNEDFDGQSSYNVERGSISDSRYHQTSVFRALMLDLSVIDIEEQEEGYRIKLSGDDDLGSIASVLPEVDQINSADAELFISREGVIRNMNLNLVGQDLLGIPQDQSYNYSVNKMENIDIERPSWISVASSRTSIIDISSNQENNWIEMKHNGLATVEEGSVIRIVTSSGRSSTVELENAFSENDTMYLAPDDPESWRVSINSQPEQPGFINFTDGDEILLEIIKPDRNQIDFMYYSDTVALGS